MVDDHSIEMNVCSIHMYESGRMIMSFGWIHCYIQKECIDHKIILTGFQMWYTCIEFASLCGTFIPCVRAFAVSICESAYSVERSYFSSKFMLQLFST